MSGWCPRRARPAHRWLVRTDGRIVRGGQARLFARGSLTDTLITSLKQLKERRARGRTGFECGIHHADDMAEGDVIECYQMCRAGPPQLAAVDGQ